jgi:hypothetical protein
MKAYITKHPKDPYTVLAQGKEVYATTDGGVTWDPSGPKGIAVKGYVRRVVIQPKTFTWMAGTSKNGQIWRREGPTWKLVSNHSDKNAYVTNMAFSPHDYRVLYVTYGGCAPHRRIQRLELTPHAGWMGIWITGDLPVKHLPSGEKLYINAIAGDGYKDNVVYIATNKGVFRGEAGNPLGYYWWKDYNTGLPLVEVKDLLVDPSSKELRIATYGRGAWTIVTGP